jgi:membrane associated rhomboid family serine protease
MYRPPGLGSIPIVIKNLIILNLLLYVATFIFGESMLLKYLALWYPETPYFHPYQFISYMFMHGGFLHVAINMFILFMFGVELETIWGPKKFLAYYIICGLGAGLLHTLINFWMLHHGGNDFLDNVAPPPMVGASGAIFGVLIAFGLMFPDRQMFFLLFPIPIKAKYMVFIWALIELTSGIGKFAGDNVAHFAHLGGMLTGLIIVLIWRKQGKFYN